MGKGGRRPPKLENLKCDNIFNLTRLCLKSHYSSKKDCKNLVMAKIVLKLKNIYITDLHHVQLLSVLRHIVCVIRGPKTIDLFYISYR